MSNNRNSFQICYKNKEKVETVFKNINRKYQKMKKCQTSHKTCQNKRESCQTKHKTIQKVGK